MADWRPHRLAVLGERPQRRWFATGEGIAAAAEATGSSGELLRTAPVSRQWFRLLAERLDAVALICSSIPSRGMRSPDGIADRRH